MNTFLEDLDGEPPLEKRRNLIPATFVAVVILAIALGLGFGVKALIGDRIKEPMSEPTMGAAEYVPPTDTVSFEPELELDEYGQPMPQRVPVDIGIYPAPERGCGTEALPRLNPFCASTSDRALSDGDVASYMVYLAAGLVAPGTIDAWPMSKDITHWLRQVIATPAEEGGPSLEHEAEYLAILDRWLADDYSESSKDYEYLRGVLGW